MGLITGLGEGIIWLIQSTLLDMDTSSVYIDVDQGVFSFEIWGWEINVNAGGIAGFILGSAGRPTRSNCWFCYGKCNCRGYGRFVWRQKFLFTNIFNITI